MRNISPVVVVWTENNEREIFIQNLSSDENFYENKLINFGVTSISKKISAFCFMISWHIFYPSKFNILDTTYHRLANNENHFIRAWDHKCYISWNHNRLISMYFKQSLSIDINYWSIDKTKSPKVNKGFQLISSHLIT